MSTYIYITDQARGQDGWILAKFSFCVFMDRDKVEAHKNAKRKNTIIWLVTFQIQISNSNFQIFKFKTNFYIQFAGFCCKTYFLNLSTFLFSLFHSRWRYFWFHKNREITKNLFTLTESNFGENKTFVHSLELWRNFICGNETGSPGRAVSLHLARSGSQWEHRICCMLPAGGACHIIKRLISLSLWNQKKRQREWKQRKHKCWWVLKILFATTTGKHKSLFWIWKFEF